MNTVTTLALNLALNNRGIYGVTIVDTMENNMVKALFYIYIYCSVTGVRSIIYLLVLCWIIL